MFTLISMANIFFFFPTFFMVCKVVAFQKVGSRVVNNEVVRWRPTYSWEMVTGTGGHQRGQKEWRLETRWNAESHKQSREAGEECCGSRSCKMSLVAWSSRSLKGVHFQQCSSA